MYVGVNGIATFVPDGPQIEAYSEIPLEKMLLETDSPFLTPTPFRGKINEPKYISIISEFIGSLNGVSAEEVGKQTTQNAEKLFGI